MWFASPGTDRVGRLDPTTGAIQTFVGPAGELRGPANLFPGIDGRIWFTCPGADRIGRIDPSAADPQATLTAVSAPESPIPSRSSRPPTAGSGSASAPPMPWPRSTPSPTTPAGRSG